MVFLVCSIVSLKKKKKFGQFNELPFSFLFFSFLKSFLYLIFKYAKLSLFFLFFIFFLNLCLHYTCNINLH